MTQSITLCLNMTKVDSKEVRAKMADANIVPAHLKCQWLQLTINAKNVHHQERWTLTAAKSYHCYCATFIAEPDQFIDVFNFIYINPDLHAHQYIEPIKLKKKQAYDLASYPQWETWVKQHSPHHFN